MTQPTDHKALMQRLKASVDRRIAEAHDAEVLVLDPNAAEEPPFARIGQGGNVKDQAANFAEELAAHVIELIVLAIEAVGVDVDHLQEAAWQVLQGEGEPALQPTQHLM